METRTTKFFFFFLPSSFGAGGPAEPLRGTFCQPPPFCRGSLLLLTLAVFRSEVTSRREWENPEPRPYCYRAQVASSWEAYLFANSPTLAGIRTRSFYLFLNDAEVAS